MPTAKESNLAHLVFCNPGHRVALCDAQDHHGGIGTHQDLAEKHGCMGTIVDSENGARSLACFLKGKSMIILTSKYCRTTTLPKKPKTCGGLSTVQNFVAILVIMIQDSW